MKETRDHKPTRGKTAGQTLEERKRERGGFLDTVSTFGSILTNRIPKAAKEVDIPLAIVLSQKTVDKPVDGNFLGSTN